jgi:hypothetical protein
LKNVTLSVGHEKIDRKRGRHGSVCEAHFQIDRNRSQGEEAQPGWWPEQIAQMAILPSFAWDIVDGSHAGHPGGSQISDPVACGDKVDACEIWKF